MAITVNAKQAREFITMNIRAGVVTMLKGHPGLGKSYIVREIADEFKLKLIDLRASQMDPTDVNGFGAIVNGQAQYIPFDVFPLEGTPIPKGYNGWMIFFDEVNSASKAVEAALYKVLLDRKIGQKKLHKNVALVCAGNLSNSGAIVNKQSTATQSRMVHLTLIADPQSWIEWATQHDLDLRVISYISSMPDALHDFDPKHNDETFACNRTWEYASKILKVAGNRPLIELLPNLAGTIGEGQARQFVAYADTLIHLPSIPEILADPKGAKLDKKPSLMHATAHLVAHHFNEKNAVKLMTYIKRMPMEFQTITLQGALSRNRDLKDNDTVQDWILEKGDTLL